MQHFYFYKVHKHTAKMTDIKFEKRIYPSELYMNVSITNNNKRSIIKLEFAYDTEQIYLSYYVTETLHASNNASLNKNFNRIVLKAGELLDPYLTSNNPKKQEIFLKLLEELYRITNDIVLYTSYQIAKKLINEHSEKVWISIYPFFDEGGVNFDVDLNYKLNSSEEVNESIWEFHIMIRFILPKRYIKIEYNLDKKIKVPSYMFIELLERAYKVNNADDILKLMSELEYE
mgnify:CR=1 FL=1